jgi:SAM-dependent methyltransferase
MHDSVLKFVERATRELPEAIRVLDIGALDVNGSARGLFPNATEYIGVDIEEGPGVDAVADAHSLMFEDIPGGFDLVLCLEMMEHDSAPWLTAAQIAVMGKPGALVLVSARGNGFPPHNPPDHFRFMETGLRSVLELGGLIVDRIDPDPQVSGWFARCTVPELAEPAKPKRKAKVT